MYGFLIAAFCLALLGGPAHAQVGRDEPPGLAESLAQEGRALGESIAEQRRLARERTETIARLERELAACGRCESRTALERELAAWRRIDQQVRRAEADTLVAMGLGSFESFDELLQGLVQSLSAQVDVGTQYTRERIQETLQAHCAAEAPRPGSADFKNIMAQGECVGLLAPDRQLAGFRLALNYCQVIQENSFVELCRTPAGCAKFDACMRSNSSIVAVCADNQARGRAKRKLDICFSSLVHPSIFARGGISAPDRDVRGGAREAQASQRERQCQLLAERLERLRERAALLPDNAGRQSLVAQQEQRWAADCSGR